MTPARQPQEYTFVCECCQNKCKVISYNAIPPDCGCLINSDIGAIWQPRPHTSAPAPAAISLKSCFGDFDDCPCDDECSVSEFCAEYCKKKSANSCGMTESQCGMVQEHEKAKAAREQVLDELFKDRAKQGGRTDGFEFYIIGVKTVESLRTQPEPHPSTKGGAR